VNGMSVRNKKEWRMREKSRLNINIAEKKEGRKAPFDHTFHKREKKEKHYRWHGVASIKKGQLKKNLTIRKAADVLYAKLTESRGQKKKRGGQRGVLDHAGKNAKEKKGGTITFIQAPLL